MPNNTTDNLANARDRIDQVDDAILDLMAERGKAVAAVRAAKAAEPVNTPEYMTALRPAREAQIMNRLLARGMDKNVQAHLILSIWREIISAGAQAQIPYEAFILEGAQNDCNAHALARNHFGPHTPITSCPNFGQLLEDMQTSDCAVGVVNLVGTGHWTDLLEAGPNAPKIFAKLPFGDDQSQAMAFSHVPMEPSGNDTTLIALKTTGDIQNDAIDILDRKGDVALVAMSGFHANDFWPACTKNLKDVLGDVLVSVTFLGVIANASVGVQS